MLAPEFLPVWGGVGTYILEIAKRIPEEHELHIATPHSGQAITDGLDPEKILPRNVHLHYLGRKGHAFFGNFQFQLDCAANIHRLIRDYDIDLVHSQSAMPDYLVSPSSLDVPIVTTIHTTIEGHIEALKTVGDKFNELRNSEKFITVFAPALKALEDRYYSDKRHYLTVSEWGKTQTVTEKGIDPSRIAVVHNGVDNEDFSPSKKEAGRSRYPDLADIDAPKILYLSRLVARKGINNLRLAIPKVLEKVDAHFIFAGSGKEPKLGAEKKDCTFLGYVPQDAPPYLYAMSDVFVLPSLYENFPISILEAMSSECAVVATSVCGIPEMIDNGRNGLLIRSNDDDAIANALVRLIEDGTLRSNIGKAARRTVKERFSWNDATLKTIKHYSRIVDSNQKQAMNPDCW
jgi:glycosyltransferase involved in cell wall biosynthesis